MLTLLFVKLLCHYYSLEKKKSLSAIYLEFHTFRMVFFSSKYILKSILGNEEFAKVLLAF